MNRASARRLCAAVAAVGLMGAVSAADPAPAERSWMERLTGKPKAVPAEGTFAAPKPAVAPLAPAVQADAVRAEQDAWQRRMDVCLKLEQIAAARGDDKLAERAAELGRQATALYKGRVARLGVRAGEVTP
jgi:hypothetical protein